VGRKKNAIDHTEMRPFPFARRLKQFTIEMGGRESGGGGDHGKLVYYDEKGKQRAEHHHPAKCRIRRALPGFANRRKKGAEPRGKGKI